MDQKDNFNGEHFSECVLLFILVSLIFFGSTNLEDLTDAP